MPHFGVAEILIIAVIFIIPFGIPLYIGLLIAWAIRTGKLTKALGSQPKPPSQPAEKLGQLKQMLDAGLISAQDYETKKADILSKM
jgi:hypothetical protein